MFDKKTSSSNGKSYSAFVDQLQSLLSTCYVRPARVMEGDGDNSRTELHGEVCGFVAMCFARLKGGKTFNGM